MWKKLVVVLCALILGTLAYAATLPDTFRVERSAVVQAPPELLFTLLSDFRRGKEWSPWEKLDPNMKKTFSGPATGVGSQYAWEGNDDVGKGSQKIVAADAPRRIVTELHFIEPFEAHNQAEFLIEANGTGSKVTWVMSGPQPFVSKVMCIFMDMDALIGKDFESGLQQIKVLAEAEAKK